MVRKKLVAGNWKMNGSKASSAALMNSLLSAVPVNAAAEVLICVPYPYLAMAESRLSGSYVSWGAQDVSEYDNGAFTGEVSASMLKDMGCTHVLVGHSERRTLFSEDDKVVAKKFIAAMNEGVTPILCVGETLAEREAGVTGLVVRRQIEAVLDCVSASGFAGAVVAYEPVWAIGTGKTATPQQAQDVHASIRETLDAFSAGLGQQTRLLYGGSMKATNAKELLGQADIDGGLIGGASLIAEDFLGIISNC